MSYFCQRFYATVGLVSLFVAPLIFVAGCDTAPAGSATILGSGVDESADPAVVAAALSDEVIDLVPADNAKIIGAVQLQTGPAGSVFGLGLDDGTRVFALGDATVDGSVVLTGAVLEDEHGNLILMQENRADGMTITHATGDTVDLDTSGGGLRISVTLNATIPPSTLVIEMGAGGEATLNEEESIIHETENPSYNVSRIVLSRKTESLKVGPRLAGVLSDDCPTVEALGKTIEQACLLWSIITARAPEKFIERTCLLQQSFLDGLRGSDPVPVDVGRTPGPEIAPKLIAALKLGQELNCQLLTNGFRVASIIKSASFPDLVCLAYSVADDGARLLTTDARSLPQVICDSLTTPAIGIGCSNTCVGADNGRCEDGGPLSVAAICLPATDCNDCGQRDVPGCSNICATARNDICEEGNGCDIGTDCHDCGGATPVPGCSDRCDSAQDGECDDAGLGSVTGGCAFGTDCTDCGPRDPEDEPEPEGEDCFDEGICNLKCPNFAPDPDCTNAELCAGKGFCCVGDGICDIQSCNETDPDCTNADLCDRQGICCDDDDVCRSAGAGFECPTIDGDCAFCANVDDLCIEGCDPPDPDCPPEGTGTVTGTVRDADTGDPLSGATVLILTSSLSTTTDGSGGFTLSDVPAGPQTLVATADGFADGSASVQVPADGSVEQSITLTKLQPDDTTQPATSFPKTCVGTGTRTLTAEGSFPGGSAVNVQRIDVTITLSENGNVTGTIDTPDGEVVEVPVIGGGTSTQIRNSQFIEVLCPDDAPNNAGEIDTVIIYNFGSVGWEGEWSDNGSFEMTLRHSLYNAKMTGTFSDTSISGSAMWPDPQQFPDGFEFKNFICSHFESSVFSRLEWTFSATCTVEGSDDQDSSSSASDADCPLDGFCSFICIEGTDPDCDLCGAEGTCIDHCLFGKDPDCP